MDEPHNEFQANRCGHKLWRGYNSPMERGDPLVVTYYLVNKFLGFGQTGMLPDSYAQPVANLNNCTICTCSKCGRSAIFWTRMVFASNAGRTRTGSVIL